LEALCGTRRRRVQVVRLDAATGEVLATVKIPSRLKEPGGVLDPTGAKVALVEGRTVEVLDLAGA
jgi:hypothetical protein